MGRDDDRRSGSKGSETLVHEARRKRGRNSRRRRKEEGRKRGRRDGGKRYVRHARVRIDHTDDWDARETGESCFLEATTLRLLEAAAEK